MPQLYHGVGTFILRRRFRGVGAIRRASGTRDPVLFAKLDRMLLTLYDQGRLDLLRALRTRQLHPLEVWDRFHTSALDQLPGADVLPLLSARWERWITQAETSEASRITRTRAGVLLMARLRGDSNLAALPAALARLRAEYLDRPRMFNLARAAALAFARDVLGKQHAVYGQVIGVRPLTERAQQVPRPLRLRALCELIAQLPDIEGGMVWTMALTGAGPKEYLEDGIEILADRVLIHGVKRAGRERVVPLLPGLVAPARSRSHLRKAWKRVAGARSLYDLRRTYANLLVEAGIPANRRRHYLGHEPQSMHSLYERPEVASWLVEDAQRIAALFR